MDVQIMPGKYVIAVSGGVDSMVLLDILQRKADVELVVAHFDHGIRRDSAQDRELVAHIARAHKLPFIYDEAHLGAQASEAEARRRRYAFLENARVVHGAQAIITAHHQDDLLETMILNMLRGTQRKGLASLKSTDRIMRPLLNVPKLDLQAYAAAHKLAWREDSTNNDPRYRRNLIRQRVMPKLTATNRHSLLAINRRAAELNAQIDAALNTWLSGQQYAQILNRRQFIALPHTVAREVMATFIGQADAQNISRPLIERLVVAGKTARPGTVHDIDRRLIFKVTAQALTTQPRSCGLRGVVD